MPTIAFFHILIARGLLYHLGERLKYKWITADPRVCHGKPVFKGTRVLVADVLDMLASGMTVNEVLKEYPQLNEEMIREALALAAELLKRERRVVRISPR